MRRIHLRVLAVFIIPIMGMRSPTIASADLLLNKQRKIKNKNKKSAFPFHFVTAETNQQGLRRFIICAQSQWRLISRSPRSAGNYISSLLCVCMCVCED